jgi:hypothetical protein
MSDYTPTTHEVRETVRAGWYVLASSVSVDAFDRWMTAHDQELREQIAKEIEASDEDWHPVAFREAQHHAAQIARGGDQR